VTRALTLGVKLSENDENESMAMRSSRRRSRLPSSVSALFSYSGSLSIFSARDTHVASLLQKLWSKREVEASRRRRMQTGKGLRGLLREKMSRFLEKEEVA